ncbi:hypothetical protein RY831_01885 [Noviherbaspirillum sp. CPCC 100848]|uniref:Uncharacterized protein n=1 Tax=Noviherbaspirillum album TaxID=3080276 RepID=A0ABU6J2Q0_9BURK|nr:hypothetical protein [Noviherbaspirillum sp. CPCC 100848]MEC4717889.1 hypothetical protein [Noviherbaspirillum sp. CPCC 100848]
MSMAVLARVSGHLLRLQKTANRLRLLEPTSHDIGERADPSRMRSRFSMHRHAKPALSDEHVALIEAQWPPCHRVASVRLWQDHCHVDFFNK